MSLPSHSWEYGAAAEALLELYDPHLSVFGPAPFPVPIVEKESVMSLAYASKKIVIGRGQDGLSNGDGAVGDPVSLGVSAVLLGKADQAYAKAVHQSMGYVVGRAPRFWNGAISHRASVAELWADFIYMAPPFLAYYAVDTKNLTLLDETVKQCSLYRQILRHNTKASYKGVWEHIIGPQSQDKGLWSTGNAWAAAGMTRVLATVMKANLNISWRNHAVDELTGYIKEIVDGVMHAPADGGLLRNYLDNTDRNNHGFGETSGTSLMVAVVYRMAVLKPDVFGKRYVQWADAVRKTIGGRDVNGSPHVTVSGVVTPAVNPLGWYDPKPFTSGSPEGQCFVVLMYAAWRDCVLEEKCSR
ncbi:family 88 glycosyl hydrolase [Cyathus striatus]|nr:family 88 glycosyl hydrolase [Cyathus striatus]